MSKPIFIVELEIEPDGDGFYGYCPDLEGIHVYAESRDEVKKHARDAVIDYLVISLRHGDPIPVEVYADNTDYESSSNKVKEPIKDIELTELTLA